MRAFIVILLVSLCVHVSAKLTKQRRDDTQPVVEKCNKAFETLVMKETTNNMEEVLNITTTIRKKIDNGELPSKELQKLSKVLWNQARLGKAVKDVLTHFYGLEATEVDGPEECKQENIAKHKGDCQKMLMQLATCTVDHYDEIADVIEDKETTFMEKMQKIEGHEETLSEEMEKSMTLIAGCFGDWYCMAKEEKQQPSKRALIKILSSFVNKN